MGGYICMIEPIGCRKGTYNNFFWIQSIFILTTYFCSGHPFFLFFVAIFGCKIAIGIFLFQLGAKIFNFRGCYGQFCLYVTSVLLYLAVLYITVRYSKIRLQSITYSTLYACTLYSKVLVLVDHYSTLHIRLCSYEQCCTSYCTVLQYSTVRLQSITVLISQYR